jgi:N6-adenosine-specific RNA methylase IME4
MGRCFRNVTEQLIVGTRPGYTKNVKSHSERNVLFAPRTTHSTKPEGLYEVIERLFDGPYLELFARKQRAGWTAWGLELVNENTPIHHLAPGL